MQKDIQKFTELKLRENDLDNTERNELTRIALLLESSLAGDIIYNEKYFMFLKFLKENKQIDFEKYEEATEEEMNQFLSEFGDSFHD